MAIHSSGYHQRNNAASLLGDGSFILLCLLSAKITEMPTVCLVLGELYRGDLEEGRLKQHESRLSQGILVFAAVASWTS